MSHIQISHIIQNLNYRKEVDAQEQAELTESIRRYGILQPILVTADPEMEGYYLLIAGFRRLEAAIACGMETVPAYIRPLEQDQVMVLQLTENIQRADVKPWDEAEQFKQLSRKMSIKDIATEIARSVTYVAQRISLANLSEFWTSTWKQSQISMSTALQVARLPEESQQLLQKKLQEGVIKSESGITDTIIRNLMTNLAKAIFPTTQMVCDGKTACVDCLKRTGNNASLFSEIQDTDYCLDPECFEENKQAWLNHLFEQARQTDPAIIPLNDAYFDDEQTGAIGWQKYTDLEEAKEEIDPSDPTIVKGIYLGSEHCGKIVPIRLVEEKKVQEEKQEDVLKKAEKEQQNKRMEKEARLLAVSKVEAALCESNTRQLDLFIAESILSPSLMKTQNMVKLLQAKFEFSPLPSVDDMRVWLLENLEKATQIGSKLTIMLCVDIHKSGCSESVFAKLTHVTGQTRQEVLKEAKASLKEAKDTQNQAATPSPKTRKAKTKPSVEKKDSKRAKRPDKAAA